jgi:hypothetical protein
MRRAPHIPLSSSGLTGRSSTPQPFDSIAGFPADWISAFAGMTGGGRDDELWEHQNYELELGTEEIRTEGAPR